MHFRIEFWRRGGYQRVRIEKKNKNFQILAPLEIKILTRALSKTVFLLGYVIIFGPFRLELFQGLCVLHFYFWKTCREKKYGQKYRNLTKDFKNLNSKLHVVFCRLSLTGAGRGQRVIQTQLSKVFKKFAAYVLFDPHIKDSAVMTLVGGLASRYWYQNAKFWVFLNWFWKQKQIHTPVKISKWTSDEIYCFTYRTQADK